MKDEDLEASRVCFTISDMTFTVTSNFWLHVADVKMRQESVFGKKAVAALLHAVKEDYITLTEPTTEWFSHREGMYVEYYKRWGASEKQHIIVHGGGGYRLHLELVEFELLLVKLRDLLFAQPMTILEHAH